MNQYLVLLSLNKKTLYVALLVLELVVIVMVVIVDLVYYTIIFNVVVDESDMVFASATIVVVVIHFLV